MNRRRFLRASGGAAGVGAVGLGVYVYGARVNAGRAVESHRRAASAGGATPHRTEASETLASVIKV